VSGFGRTVERQRAVENRRAPYVRRRRIVALRKSSIDPARWIICPTIQSSATSGPLIHRYERCEGVRPRRIEMTHVIGRGIAGNGQHPLDGLEHTATRPNASAAAKTRQLPDHPAALAPDDLNRVCRGVR
jgi:hypothetical protein